MKVSYETITGENGAFDVMVNSRLSNGWELYGSPYTIIVSPTGECWFCQAIIKKEAQDGE